LTVEAEESEMSNPHDDPRHRPPQPRQGEPHPYHGGPPLPPPNHPPTGPWEGQGYGPPPHPGPPGDYALRKPKGFFGALFDINFDEMVSTRLIKAFYVLAILLITLTSVFIFLVGLWALQFGWGKYFGVFLIPAAPLLGLLELVMVRMVLEFVINQFKITEHLKAVRERDGLR
jgi:hypothetical protein